MTIIDISTDIFCWIILSWMFLFGIFHQWNMNGRLIFLLSFYHNKLLRQNCFVFFLVVQLKCELFTKNRHFSVVLSFVCHLEIYQFSFKKPSNNVIVLFSSLILCLCKYFNLYFPRGKENAVKWIIIRKFNWNGLDFCIPSVDSSSKSNLMLWYFPFVNTNKTKKYQNRGNSLRRFKNGSKWRTKEISIDSKPPTFSSSSAAAAAANRSSASQSTTELSPALLAQSNWTFVEKLLKISVWNWKSHFVFP